MCKVIRCDSFSELPGILLGTSWTVRSSMQLSIAGNGCAVLCCSDRDELTSTRGKTKSIT